MSGSVYDQALDELDALADHARVLREWMEEQGLYSPASCLSKTLACVEAAKLLVNNYKGFGP